MSALHAQCRQDLTILIPEGWPRIAQRLNVGCAGLEVHKSRQGRLNPCEIGQSSFQDLSCCGRGFPTFKRWAILECPSGTKTWIGFSGLLCDQILVALDIFVRNAEVVNTEADKNVRAPEKMRT